MWKVLLKSLVKFIFFLIGGDKKLLAEIKKAKMAPFYRSVCKELKWKEDSKLWTEMTAENEVEIKALDEKIADAEANLGESEHRSVENFSICLLFTFISRGLRKVKVTAKSF